MLKGSACLTQHNVDLFLFPALVIFFSLKDKVSQVTPYAILLPSVYLRDCATLFALPKIALLRVKTERRGRRSLFSNTKSLDLPLPPLQKKKKIINIIK